MPWEKRGGNRYYVRHRHIAGKMQRTYFGRGPEAELAAALDEQKQVDRQARWEVQRTESARLQDLVDAVHSLNVLAEMMGLAALYSAGYRQHDRGEWRRRRNHG